MEFLTIYFVGVIVLFLLLALVAGIAGERHPDIIGPIGTIIVMWPIVLVCAIVIAPFIGLWILGNWIRRRFLS